MRQLVVLSGKGGTGKTTVAAALGHLASQEGVTVLADADVEAPNLGLLLKPRVIEVTPFFAGSRAFIASDACTGCGRCEEVCRFDAIGRRDGLYQVEQTACEGCAACYFQCPAEAIEMQECLTGRWFRSETRFGPLLHAQLEPGRENSGKLVATIRQQALLVADEWGASWLIVDGSPGIGCPVIAAMTGADLALMVSEPTVSGLSDLRRILEVAEHFRVPTAVCVNKADINPELTEEILAHCVSRDIPVLAALPYAETVITAMRRGLAVTEMGRSPLAAQIQVLWDGLKKL